MVERALASMTQLIFSMFELYTWQYDPWNARGHLPPMPVSSQVLSGLIMTMPHVLLGAFCYATHHIAGMTMYLGYLSVLIAYQLYLWWFPYLFGLISFDRYFKTMTEQGAAERILPKFPGYTGRLVPTTEATYKSILLLLTFLLCNLVVLRSPKPRKAKLSVVLLASHVMFLSINYAEIAGKPLEVEMIYALLFCVLYCGLFAVLSWNFGKRYSENTNSKPSSQKQSTKHKKD